jgi:XTP/dITP diphosphohydrolase
MTTRKQIVLGSHNAKKLAELKQLIALIAPELADWEITSATDLKLAEPVEDGATFLDNARLKAWGVRNSMNWPRSSSTVTIADDSGLIVDILGNAPGVLSARWSGKHGDDFANNQLLLAQLEGLPEQLRRAKFVTTCVAVYGEQEIVATGQMSGTITTEMRGVNGFGYDNIFIPDAYADTGHAGQTTAELSAELKNAISHRHQAVSQLVGELAKIVT